MVWEETIRGTAKYGDKAMKPETTPIEWLPGVPTEPGVYVVTAAIEGRKRQASICHWDGKLFQHWSGFYDHAITHYMPTDLPEGPRK